MATIPVYNDLYVPPPGMETTVVPVIGFPFAMGQIPDTTTKEYRRDFIVNPATYTPRIAVRTAGVPDSDPSNASAYLCEETLPEYLNERFATVKRTFCMIPGDQVSYTSRSFSRPNLHGIKVGSYYGVSFDDGKTSWLFAARKAIAPGGIASITASSATRSGTITRTGTNPSNKEARTPDALPSSVITFSVSTGSTGNTISANASAATWLSVMSIHGISGTASSTPGQTVLRRTSGNSITSIECSDPSVVISGSPLGDLVISRIQTSAYSDTTETVSESESQNITETYSVDGSVRRFTTSASHGGNAGDYVVFWKGDKIVAMSNVVAVPTSTTFDVPLSAVAGKDFSADYVGFSSAAAVRYVNGQKDCTIKVIQKFYLPGVTPGIATGADIPTTPLFADAIGWLTAISSGMSYAAIAVADVKSWKGPILVKTIEEVQMSDALESRSVNA